MKLTKILGLGIFLLLPMLSLQADPANTNDSPWNFMLYRGELAESDLLKVFTGDYTSGNETIYSAEVEYELSPANMIRHYLQPFSTTVYFANNVSYIDDPEGPVYEYDPFFLVQWGNFPWDKYVVNTFGIGWGVSYDTRVTTWEKHDSDNTKRLLNYLAFETTLAFPRYPQWQLVVRLHHRSGAFGLYGADNSGSNYVGVGIRYHF